MKISSEAKWIARHRCRNGAPALVVGELLKRQLTVVYTMHRKVPQERSAEKSESRKSHYEAKKTTPLIKVIGSIRFPAVFGGTVEK